MIGTTLIAEDVPSAFASLVIETFNRRSSEGFSIAFSGGSTARRCYERLACDGATAIDWRSVTALWGDERCVPLDDVDSNHRLVREALLDRVGPLREVLPMVADEGPLAYDATFRSHSPVDLIHLGLGPDGHTASLFPGSEALAVDDGRFVVLNSDPLGNNPHERMTLTYAGIASARLVVVTVEGESKREAFDRVRRDDRTAPASSITADSVIWIVDPAAMGQTADR